MKTRINDLPIFERRPFEMDAELYNTVTVALHRLKPPFRIPLDGLRGLEMLIDDELWICVDTSMNDLPVMAWVEFNAHERQSLHQPVPCELRLYHGQAGVILSRALDRIYASLRQALKPPDEGDSDTVINLPTERNPS